MSEKSNKSTALSITSYLMDWDGLSLQKSGLTDIIVKSVILINIVVVEDISTEEYQVPDEEMYLRLNEDQCTLFDYLKKSITIQHQ